MGGASFLPRGCSGLPVWSHRPEGRWSEVLQEERGFAGNSLLLLQLLGSDSPMEVM